MSIIEFNSNWPQSKYNVVIHVLLRPVKWTVFKLKRKTLGIIQFDILTVENVC